MTRLSKSRIMSSLQCLKRVYLEVNRRELARYSKATEAAFALGHEVGNLAIRLYGDSRGVFIPYNGGSFTGALAQTEELMTSMFRAPVFEATLQFEGVLVREDVLLPVTGDEGDSWRVVEVKASTRVKPEHVHDCAVQAWVHQGAGFPLQSIALAHVDKQFVYQGGGDYGGLFIENDLTEPVNELMPAVPVWVDRAREAAEGPMPQVAVGQHCTSPYQCPFIAYCWPHDSDYPVSGLGGGRKKLGLWVVDGYRDIRDVPSSDITSEVQLRIHRVTMTGEPELLSGAREFVKALDYPRFYLDFETIGPAIPVWPGTRPYQVLPFQWSCHIERAPGVMEHAEFLDLSGDPPMRALAEQLIETLKPEGPVLMYTDYERTVIKSLTSMFPDLAESLQGIIERLVDLHPVTKINYYHPDMLGSWSIKAVLPTIAPDMDYAGLEGIQEGTAASVAYLEAINPATSQQRKEEIRRELLEYCKYDTEAMVRLAAFFTTTPPTDSG
ncbi:MAG: DUF2779 domain-containing protein [Xanthomonadales bacterium]|nr:DUF2779 domain-containing protein [Gammaproteobacteria bacterium]NND57411.1 DUF2779 domain-containing protein [Xanthomonadales bacterium]NNK50340.1 DUF2779 domain-containing protein [Xanthomonadales bacterium]